MGMVGQPGQPGPPVSIYTSTVDYSILYVVLKTCVQSMVLYL